MRLLFNTPRYVYRNKRQLLFYTNIDNQKKRLQAFNFCTQVLKASETIKKCSNFSIYPELNKNELLLKYNKLTFDMLQEVLKGKYFEQDYKIVFKNSKTGATKSKEKVSLAKYIEEMTIKTTDFNYENSNVFNNFKEVSKFLSPKNNPSTENTDTFIKCLCHIYIGNNIHSRINNEISKRTNFYILKGDYFFSLGYYTLSRLGDPLLIKFYSKISENFASSNFYLDITKINNHIEFDLYLNHLVRKSISFVYYGCLGIKQTTMKNPPEAIEEQLKYFSFQYGLLLYLRDELIMLKNRSFEYFTKIEEFVNLFLFFSEGLTKIALFHLEYLKNKIKELLTDKACLKKYELLAISLCSQIFDSIDSIHNSNPAETNAEGIKDHIRGLFQEIQTLASL